MVYIADDYMMMKIKIIVIHSIAEEFCKHTETNKTQYTLRASVVA